MISSIISDLEYFDRKSVIQIQIILFEKNSKSIFLKKAVFSVFSSKLSIKNFQEELNFESIYWELKSQQNSTGDLTNCKLK